MSSEEKLKEVLSFLKLEILYDKKFDSYLDEIFTYMKYNMNSPLTLEFNIIFNTITKELYKQLNELDSTLKNIDIKNKEFKNAFVISHIPFKCDEQYFIYKMIKALNNDYSIDSTFDSILPKLNKYIYNNSIDCNGLLKRIDSNSDYNVLLNKNFYEENRKKALLLAKYQDGTLVIDDPRKLNDTELGVVGYRGELYFKTKYESSDSKKLIVWNSQNINGYAHVDFLEYDHKTDHLYPHEIKTTVTNDALNDCTITKSEFEYLYDTLDSKNITYLLHKYAFSKDLNYYNDGITFEIIDKENVNGKKDNGQETNSFMLKCKNDNKYYEFYTKMVIMHCSGFEDTKKKLALTK